VLPVGRPSAAEGRAQSGAVGKRQERPGGQGRAGSPSEGQHLPRFSCPETVLCQSFCPDLLLLHYKGNFTGRGSRGAAGELLWQGLLLLIFADRAGREAPVHHQKMALLPAPARGEHGACPVILDQVQNGDLG